MRRALPLLTLCLMSQSHAVTHRLLLGPYTRDGSRGIYSTTLDGATGALTAPVLAAEARNASWLAPRPDGRVIYSVDETAALNPDGKPAGAISAFAYDRATGALTKLNSQPYAAGFGPPCHLVVDATGRLLIATNYGGGNLAAFRLAADGSLGERVAFVQHTGGPGPVAARQDKPHAHSTTLSPDNRFAFVCDLGLDRVFAYRIDPAAGTLAPAAIPFAVTAPGSGPRHAKFSPDGKFLHVLGELDAHVTTFAYDAARGALTPVQHLASLPAGFTGENTAAEIRLSADGRFAYASNRGHDSLAVFSRDQKTGALALLEIVPCGGKTPRHFNFSPDGRWLVCAHQGSGTLTVFRVAAATGRLTPTATRAGISTAVCVLFP